MHEYNPQPAVPTHFLRQQRQFSHCLCFVHSILPIYSYSCWSGCRPSPLGHSAHPQPSGADAAVVTIQAASLLSFLLFVRFDPAVPRALRHLPESRAKRPHLLVLLPPAHCRRRYRHPRHGQGLHPVTAVDGSPQATVYPFDRAPLAAAAPVQASEALRSPQRHERGCRSERRMLCRITNSSARWS